MKISYNWLQTFFSEPLPPASLLEELLTFHSSEIEEVIEVEGDTVIDVKVLPDKSAWLLSHRGVAKEVATLLGRQLVNDPLAIEATLVPKSDRVALTLETAGCDYYSAAIMKNVKVAPSPAWLQDRLRAIGQRPINNVVDVANYVMFEMGQPLHAFDADKLTAVGERYAIGVRQAEAGEQIVTLTGDSFALTDADMVIVDGATNTPIALAGVKGGAVAAVDEHTTTLLIESAHFDRVSVRKTAQRHNLRTDASQRYENGVPRAMAPLGLLRVCALLAEITGGIIEGHSSVGLEAEVRVPVSVSLAKINAVLGLTLTEGEVGYIFERLGYHYSQSEGVFLVTPPLERDDLVIAEDLIEEVGRFYGLTKINAIAPETSLVPQINARHYYSQKIRHALLALGFSEVMTSSFRDYDEVKLKNALASDKGYLRSSLSKNLSEVLAKNAPNRDLLGLSAVKVFEIGTVFSESAEAFHLGLAVRTGSEYKAKVDDRLLAEAKEVIEATLDAMLLWNDAGEGVSECSLTLALETLPAPTAYEPAPPLPKVLYKPFSLYPAVSRDIALWVPSATTVEEVAAGVRAAAGALCVRHTLFDTFSKEGRTSFAFRFVFQAPDRTLTASEADTAMQAVTKTAQDLGGEVR